MAQVSWYTPEGQTNIRRAYDNDHIDVAEISANVDRNGNILDWRWRLLGKVGGAEPSEGGTDSDEEHAKSSAEVAYRQAIKNQK